MQSQVYQQSFVEAKLHDLFILTDRQRGEWVSFFFLSQRQQREYCSDETAKTILSSNKVDSLWKAIDWQLHQENLWLTQTWSKARRCCDIGPGGCVDWSRQSLIWVTVSKDEPLVWLFIEIFFLFVTTCHKWHLSPQNTTGCRVGVGNLRPLRMFC